MHKVFSVICIVCLFASLFLFGCTSNTPPIPYSNSQFINRSTDLNLYLFNSSNYSGDAVVIDGNKFSAKPFTDSSIVGAVGGHRGISSLDGGAAGSDYNVPLNVDGGASDSNYGRETTSYEWVKNLIDGGYA